MLTKQRTIRIGKRWIVGLKGGMANSIIVPLIEVLGQIILNIQILLNKVMFVRRNYEIVINH